MTILRFTALACLSTFYATIAAANTDSSVHNVALRVTDVRGTPIQAAYVATYRETQPWEKPRSEHLTDSAGSAPVELETGKNVILVAAEGFPPKMVILQGETGGTKRTVRLDTAVSVNGSVSDESGNGIPDARMSVLRPDYAPGAQRYLARRETLSDPSGGWTLAVPPQGNSFLIEAPGYAAGFATAPIVEAGGLDIALVPAVPLAITFDRVDPDLIVTLRSERSGLTEIVQDMAWSRPVAIKTIEWETVPAGTVVVLVRHRDSGRFLYDRRVGTFTLEPGKPFAANISLPPVPPRASTFVSLFAKTTEAAQPAPYRVVSNRSIEPVDVSMDRVIAGVVLNLNVSDARDLVIPTRTHILLPDIPRDKPVDSLLRAIALPRADASLRVSTAGPDLPLPAVGTAEYQQCSGKPRTLLPFGVRSDGAVSLIAPADCVRTILRWPPFEPIVVERKLPAGQQTALGDFELRAGSTVEVHVKREGTQTLIEGAVVRVLFNASDVLPLAHATTDGAGRAVIEGLPSLRRLYIEARESHTALTGSVVTDLFPGERRIIDPLSVQKLAKVIVRARIAPDLLSRFPEARVETVRMEPLDADAPKGGMSRKVANADPVIFDVRPGQWRVRAIIHGALEHAGQVVDIGELTIAAGEERTFEPEIAPPVFIGRVTHQGRGVKATIHIADTPTMSAMSGFPTREDGSFTALLSRLGVFGVEVRLATSEGSPLKVGQVSFEDPSRPVEIPLVFGQVTVRVRTDDSPVAAAKVTLTSYSSGIHGLDTAVMSAVADQNGRAVFETVRAGTWLVNARVEDDLLHGQKVVSITADAASLVELQLKRSDIVAGVVRDSAGRRIADARVACVFSGPARVPEVSRTNTSSDGSFKLRIHPVQGFASCAVVTPTRAVATFPFRGSQRHADVVLPPPGGSLLITNWWAGYNDWFWLVSDDGSVVSLRDVALGTGQTGGPLFIGSLRAGTWKIVRVSTPDALTRLANGNALTLPEMESLRVIAGNSATIDLRIGVSTTGPHAP